MRSIGLLLLILGSALTAAQYTPYNQVQNLQSTGGVTESFLNRLTPEAASAYARLIENKTQSLTDLKKALEQWASYYGIQVRSAFGLKKFNCEMLRQTEQENANFKKAIDELLPKLEIFFRSYMAMVSDKTQSIGSLLNKTSALAAQLNEQQERIVRFIFQTYMPSLQNVAGANGNNAVYPGFNGAVPNGNGYPGNNGLYPGTNGWGSGNGGYPGNSGGYPNFNGAYPGGFNNGWLNGGYPSTNGAYQGGNSVYPGNFGGYPGFGGSNGFQTGTSGSVGNVGGFQGQGTSNSGLGGFHGQGFQGQGGTQGGNSGFPNTNGGFQGQGGPQSGSSGFPGTWGSQGNTGSFPGSQNAGGFPNGGQQVNGGFQGTNGMTFPGVNNGFQGSFGGQSRPAFGSASGKK
ncbi:hypothetical protein Q1695_007788 [Nippostrongylus brasiliensis]|nr:hypothetical protein Q1695_007788 [Nippostrongylus brasiliensis]